jgi:Fe-S oxidoreductase
LRMIAFKRKKAQLDAINVETLVTSCSNCRNVLQDGLEHNHMSTSVVGLTELIAEHLAPAAK